VMRGFWGTGWVAVAALALAVYAGRAEKGDRKVDTRVFEMRTYYAPPGKMDALHARFRDHTCKLFKKHGMTIIGFWNPTDKEQAEKKLVCILAYPRQEAADRRWPACQAC